MASLGNERQRDRVYHDPVTGRVWEPVRRSIAPPNTPADALSLSPNSPHVTRSQSRSLNADAVEPRLPLRGLHADSSELQPTREVYTETGEPRSARGYTFESPSLRDPIIPPDLDLRDLIYVDKVDENLSCPICHVPLVDPVVTACDHTFCSECIEEALKHSELCPIDRLLLPKDRPLGKVHKIVTNQLDALLVLCPTCDDEIPRSMLQNHLDRYCKDALVKCARGRACGEKVFRRDYELGCLHFTSTCPDCQKTMWEANIEHHREFQCKERYKTCDHCDKAIKRLREKIHLESCSHAIAKCKWAEYGCDFEARRKDLRHHAGECAFKLVGPMAEMLKKEINELRTEVRTLTEKDLIQERRIKFLENGQRDNDRTLDYADLPSQALNSLSESSHADPLDSGHEYLLSLVEAQETKVDRLSTGMTDLEAKHTMMLFNETIPLKNELAEMRSSQQVLSMHVRWLMNFKRQENQRRFGAGPSSGGGSDGRDSSDTGVGRRLSDSGNGLVTKL